MYQEIHMLWIAFSGTDQLSIQIDEEGSMVLDVQADGRICRDAINNFTQLEKRL